MNSSTRARKLLSVRELVLFALLGTLMAISDVLMEGLPNIHIVGLFIAATTLCFRWRAVFPVAVYVFLIGLFSGFGLWWLAYLYAWPLLWVLLLLIPRRLPKWAFFLLSHLTVTLHGLAFGVITAPVVALMWRLDTWEKVLATIAAGLAFDILHGVGNFVFGFFIPPLTALLERLTYGKR